MVSCLRIIAQDGEALTLFWLPSAKWLVLARGLMRTGQRFGKSGHIGFGIITLGQHAQMAGRQRLLNIGI